MSSVSRRLYESVLAPTVSSVVKPLNHVARLNDLSWRNPAHNQIGVCRLSANTSVPLPQKLTCPIVSSPSPSGPGRVQAPSGTIVCLARTLKYAASPLYGQYVRGDIDGSRQPGVTSAIGM